MERFYSIFINLIVVSGQDIAHSTGNGCVGLRSGLGAVCHRLKVREKTCCRSVAQQVIQGYGLSEGLSTSLEGLSKPGEPCNQVLYYTIRLPIRARLGHAHLFGHVCAHACANVCAHVCNLAVSFFVARTQKCTRVCTRVHFLVGAPSVPQSIVSSLLE